MADEYVDVVGPTSVNKAKPIKYPGTDLLSAPITHKSWAAVDPAYKPTAYTSEDIAAGTEWADPAVSVYVAMVCIC